MVNTEKSLGTFKGEKKKDTKVGQLDLLKINFIHVLIFL